jgi:hypothetical protein
VSPKANQELKQFLDTYNTNGIVGQVVSAGAAVLYFFGLVTDIENVVNIDIDEAFTVLSGPSVFATAWRAQALAYIREQITPKNAHTQEGRMWQRLYDVIRDPSRYKDGGAKVESGRRNLMLRALPAERLRSIAGSHVLTAQDRVEVSKLIAALRGYHPSMDYLATSDLILDVYTATPNGLTISARDQYLLNHALLVLPVPAKNSLKINFRQNAERADLNSQLWRSHEKYLEAEEWDRDSEVRLLSVMAGDTDDLGYVDDFRQFRDTFWRDVPSALSQTATVWKTNQSGNPAPNIWTFHWPGN